MEAFPTEILLKIGKCLDVKDLLACCAVSSRWRDVFGCDEIWRPYCDAEIEQLLKTTPGQVEPTFSSLQTDDTSLSPIGRWRLAFMRETHVWRNWIHGNYKAEKAKLEANEKILLLGHNFIMIWTSKFLNTGILKIRDISVNGSDCVAQLKVGSADEYCLPTLVKDDMVVIVSSKNIVRVIEVSVETPALSVKHSFCIDDSLETRVTQVIPHFVVNTVLLALGNDCIYIWDLEKGAKLKTERCFSHITKSIIQSKNCEDIVITGLVDDTYYHHIYSTKELKCWPLTIERIDHVEFAIMNDYIASISCPRTSIKVYKYKISQLVFEIPMTQLKTSLWPEVRVFKDSFIYYFNNRLLQLFPRNGSTRRIVRSNLSRFMPIGDKLLLVVPHALSHIGDIQIWKIGPKSIVKTLVPYKGSMIINNAYSKIVLEDRNSEKFYLYFW